MKSDGRLTRPRSTDLDLTPTASAHAKTEHFGDGLFRGPPTGEMQDVRTAVHLLPFCVDAIEKPAGVFLQHVTNACGLNDVDADFGTHKEKSRRATKAGVARGSGVRASR